MKTTASREFLRARARSLRRFHTTVRQLNTTAIRPTGKKNRAAETIDHTRCVRGWVGSSAVTTPNTRPLPSGRSWGASSLAEIEAACAQAADGLEPFADEDADAEFRKHLVTVLTKRAVATAAGISS